MTAIIITNLGVMEGISNAVAKLQSGASPLDIIEAGIRPNEADPELQTVGYGSSPNMLGELELDAAIMDGDTLQVGAIGALKGYKHPITIARAVMERLPHTMLVGEGAAMFAHEIGAEKIPLPPETAQESYRSWLRDAYTRAKLKEAEIKATGLKKTELKETGLEEARLKKNSPAEIGKTGICLSEAEIRQLQLPQAALAWPTPCTPEEKDTIIYLVRDSQGRIAAGTSTSGWPYKYPGRLGDSPIIGAGLYADSAYGACACTNTGEMTMRASTARSVVLYMKKGASVSEACHEAVEDLRRLKGGYIGSVCIYAIDRDGQHSVVRTTTTQYEYWMWRGAEITTEEMLLDEIPLTTDPWRY